MSKRNRWVTTTAKDSSVEDFICEAFDVERKRRRTTASKFVLRALVERSERLLGRKFTGRV